MKLPLPSLRAPGSRNPDKPGSATLSLFKYTFLTRAWPIWARYVVTALIVLAALGLKLAVRAYFPGSPFLLFFFAIILSSALFDYGSGIFAVLLSAGLAKWFLIEPAGTLYIERTEDVFGLSIFIAIGLVTAAILEALHRVARDLADTNELLLQSEADKDLVLQEASHRFKNELTMLVALLRLQERLVKDSTGSAALRSTADRVHVLARVHERLQRSHTTAVVDTREFVSTLCDDLKEGLIGSRPITLKVEAESHFLPQERVVPVGLAINELLTNALKYAFPEEKAGTVRVSFFRQGNEFCLSVADDGIGMAYERDPAGTGLGQRLVRSMIDQLQGTYEIEPNSGGPGTVVTVRFPAHD
jgi:two-component sensor histidine kinase